MAETEVLVRCTVELWVKVPEDWDDDMIHFDLVENHCPGTGTVGGAFDREIRECDDKGICWGCKAKGKNEILEIHHGGR